MSDTPDTIEAAPETVVSTFNDATPDHAPVLEWWAMSSSTDRDRAFVFAVPEYADPNGLQALRDAGIPITYIEGYHIDSETEIQIHVPVSEVPGA
jgi:hypothetical protein